MSEIGKAARDMMRDYVETFPDMREHLVSREYALALLNAADERDALAAENARLREVQSAALDLCEAWDASGFSRKCLVTGTPGWTLYKLIRSGSSK